MKICVIGGGPAGIMAAGTAAKEGASVTLIDGNEKLCKKLFITGKGRCNITNNCTEEEFISNVVTNPRFLYSAIRAFSPQSAMDFFESLGCPLKTERGKRVFPQSDKSVDIIIAFEKFLKRNKINIELNTKCRSITYLNGGFTVKTGSESRFFDRVIICGGGASYSLTGSDGSIFNIIKSLGHTVTELKPALCALVLKEDYVGEMAGLSLKNVRATALYNGKKLFSEQGEMLFTHEGVSGPLILSMSSHINKYDVKEVTLSIDLKPALDEKTLINRINGDLCDAKNKIFKNSLGDLLPKSLIPIIIKLSGISPDIQSNSVTAQERRKLANLLKNLSFKIVALGGLGQAIVTSGGVCVKEINSSTMESKLLSGLFFAGEVIDVDALTGGFNIQTALSTGYLAGQNAAL